MSYMSIGAFLENELPKLRFAVLGDVMVDRYIYGEVNRISPEAPVPVNRVKRISSTLGGAANVASNLSHLGCHVDLVSVVGDDSYGAVLKELALAAHIEIDHMLTSSEVDTITKVRILDDKQQMLRLDFETVRDITTEMEERIAKNLESLLKKGLDGIVISDYGKGFLTPSMTQRIIALAKKYKVKTVVDPKGTAWKKYDGADFITPNLKEISEYLGHSVANTTADVVQAAHKVKDDININHIVVTRSEQGVSLINDSGSWYCPAVEQTVYDVSGAGDTVVSMLIAASAGDLSNREALWLCNIAAGVVVKKVGTYPIHRQEMLDEWKKFGQSTKKNVTLSTTALMKEYVKTWQENGETVVFTNGCFDILHYGHVSYLKKAASLGDRFIIAVNSDASVKRLKGEERPLNHEKDRAFLLENLAFVDGVIIFEEDTPYEVIKEIRPNILVKGGDYKPEDVVGRDLVDEVIIIPFENGYSTTGLIEKIKTQGEK